MGWRAALLVLGLTALPRLVVFPFAENTAGDAVVRAWLAHAWLEHPHLIGASSQGCLQFGPLHVPLIALVEWLIGREHLAGRLLSLLFGVASALPLFALGRRLFSERAAWWSVAAFALWPLHVQASTTAASEAVSGFLVLVAIACVARALETKERPLLLLGGLMLTLGAAVRYDVWLWIGLVALIVWWRGGSFGRAVAFGAVAASFPLAWLVAHQVDAGDWLAPVRLIDDYHRTWFRSEAALWGEGTYRAIVLGFWPLTALVTFTPVGAAIGAAALARSWRTDGRWLALLVVVPALLLSLRGALLSSFVPLSRFTMKELSLFTLFVGAGLASLEARWRQAAVASVSLAVAWLPLLELAAQARWRWASSFRAVSALSLNNEDLRVIAKALRERAAPADIVAVDVDPRGFDDLQLAFESGLPFRQVARRRAPSFDAFAAPGPRWMVRFEGGVLTGSAFPLVRWREVASSGPITLLERE
ncbi:MAG: glycosyltransferase family 39 protein [Myxococcaceae bacterium]|nr:glycosyltransferase family 39 protein [Myxococcaceae bacterium]